MYATSNTKIDLVASLVPATVVDNVGHQVVRGPLLVFRLVLKTYKLLSIEVVRSHGIEEDGPLLRFSLVLETYKLSIEVARS